MKLHEWETIDTSRWSTMPSTYRMKVPGGWLYRYGNTAVSSMVFVPEATE
ncbi:hypothetical protein [Sinorhizobium meliloti]|nr:hypothetical protein [Sinorhizobium meliloti]